MKIEHTKILFAVLNWGLGHATRSMALIKRLQLHDNEIVIASSGASLLLLKSEFLHNKFIELPDYEISYYSKNMVVNGLRQYPKVAKAIKAEQEFISKGIIAENIQLIISDNRYGIYHPEVKSVLITHQLKLMMPQGFGWLESLVQRKNLKYFSNFNEIWVPDFEGEDNLSGALSHGLKLPMPVKFIGPLSRFILPKEKPILKYDIAFIFSGPEPARSRFEERVRIELSGYQGNIALVLGRVGERNLETKGNFHVFNHLNYKEMETLILSSKHIVCRSGYTSIMDLWALKKKAILIPTPGQPEQEYLSTYHDGKNGFISVAESNFSIDLLSVENL